MAANTLDKIFGGALGSIGLDSGTSYTATQSKDWFWVQSQGTIWTTPDTAGGTADPAQQQQQQQAQPADLYQQPAQPPWYPPQIPSNPEPYSGYTAKLTMIEESLHEAEEEALLNPIKPAEIPEVEKPRPRMIKLKRA